MIAGIVLAAGRSSRLGRNKQLLPIQGEPLLRYTLRQIGKSRLDPILVVVGHEAAAVRQAIGDLPVRVIFNPDFALGQSTSVRAGVAALPATAAAAMFLLGDQPGVKPEVIAALIASWRKSGVPVVAPRYADGIGNPILFDRRVFPEFDALSGDTGARPIVNAHERAGNLLFVPVEGMAPFDIDTEDDVAVVLASLEIDQLR